LPFPNHQFDLVGDGVFVHGIAPGDDIATIVEPLDDFETLSFSVGAQCVFGADEVLLEIDLT
jgi:hypothetical protein